MYVTECYVGAASEIPYIFRELVTHSRCDREADRKIPMWKNVAPTRPNIGVRSTFEEISKEEVIIISYLS